MPHRLLPRPMRVRTLSLMAALFWPAATIAQQYPRSPQSPTVEDCRRLSHDYYTIQQRIRSQLSACMEQPARIGYGAECSLVAPSYRLHEHALRGWVQCEQYEAPLCDAYRQGDQEVRQCEALARKQGREDERLSALMRATSSAAALGTAWNTARNLIANPVQFFFDQAVAKTTKAAFPSWRGEGDIGGDPRAQEIYRYLQQQTKLGTRAATSDPVIRSIQNEALTQLMAHFKRLQLQLNSAADQIRTFSIDQQMNVGPSKPAPPSSEQPTDNSYRPTRGLCQTLGTC